MNRRQKIVVLIGVAVVALMLLVPPWQRQSSGYRSTSGGVYSPPAMLPGNYGFLFYPPAGAARVDISRLAVQCVLVGVLTFGVYVLVGHKKES